MKTKKNKELTLYCLNCGRYITAEEEATLSKKRRRWCKHRQFIPGLTFCEEFVPKAAATRERRSAFL